MWNATSKVVVISVIIIHDATTSSVAPKCGASGGSQSARAGTCRVAQRPLPVGDIFRASGSSVYLHFRRLRTKCRESSLKHNFRLIIIRWVVVQELLASGNGRFWPRWLSEVAGGWARICSWKLSIAAMMCARNILVQFKRAMWVLVRHRCTRSARRVFPDRRHRS